MHEISENTCVKDIEAVWIEQYRSCDPKPFTLLVEKYYQYSFHLFIIKGVFYEAAKDCCQDVWTGFVRNLKVVRLRRPFKVFLDRAITYRTCSFFRQIMAERELFAFLPEENDELYCRLIDLVPISEKSLLEHVIQKEVCYLLRKCIDLILNEDIKVAICLWLDGYLHKEIAHIMETNIGTASAWIARGKQSIRKCLRKKLNAE